MFSANIFCLFLSFCTFIIAFKTRLSIANLRKIAQKSLSCGKCHRIKGVRGARV